METSCEPIETLEDAMRDVPFSLLPTTGLRRNAEGDLTDDAVQIVMDGLKSRGYDYLTEEPRKNLLNDFSKMECITGKQYDFLLDEYSKRLEQNGVIEAPLEGALQRRDYLMRDIQLVSRRLNSIQGSPTQEAFIEGWQNSPSSMDHAPEMRARVQTRKRMVDVTREKNVHASNYLGLYGFLNIAALGLLIYAVGLTPRT